jgi:hypothetical protein
MKFRTRKISPNGAFGLVPYAITGTFSTPTVPKTLR